MKYERKFVNISAFRRAALLSVSRRDTERSVALLRGRKDALLSDAERGEDRVQGLLWSDETSCDFCQMGKSNPKVFCYQVAAESCLYS